MPSVTWTPKLSSGSFILLFYSDTTIETSQFQLINKRSLEWIGLLRSIFLKESIIREERLCGMKHVCIRHAHQIELNIIEPNRCVNFLLTANDTSFQLSTLYQLNNWLLSHFVMSLANTFCSRWLCYKRHTTMITACTLWTVKKRLTNYLECNISCMQCRLFGHSTEYVNAFSPTIHCVFWQLFNSLSLFYSMRKENDKFKYTKLECQKRKH